MSSKKGALKRAVSPYGVRDLESMTPAQATDRVAIASATKTMTAVAVLRLVDDHLIGLDDPVNESFPDLHPHSSHRARLP